MLCNPILKCFNFLVFSVIFRWMPIVAQFSIGNAEANSETTWLSFMFIFELWNENLCLSDGRRKNKIEKLILFASSSGVFRSYRLFISHTIISLPIERIKIDLEWNRMGRSGGQRRHIANKFEMRESNCLAS